MGSLRHRCCGLTAVLVLVFFADAFGQSMAVSQNWLTAASGSDSLKVALLTLEPATYQLLFQGDIAVRWNGQFLPARMIGTSWYPYPAVAALEFTVPAALRRPGFTEFVLWNAQAQQPLPYRGWIAVLIPTRAAVFEADSSTGQVVAAVAAEGGSQGRDEQVRVYQLSTGVLSRTFDLPAPQKVLAFTPDTQHAWILQDESQGRLARMDLLTGAIDRQMQVAVEASATLSAQVYRHDPRILLVSIRSLLRVETRAYLDGVALPGTVQGVVVPFAADDRGRLIVLERRCELSPVSGFTNCTDILPGRRVAFTAVWKNKGFTGWEVLDLTTGSTLFAFGGGGYTALYLAESNRVAFSYYGSTLIADADSLEILANVSSMQADSQAPQRLWAPDWLMARSERGILVTHLPQLAPAPAFSPQGIVNAASGIAGPVAPGEIISIYGQNLGPVPGSGPVLETRVKLATEVERTEVLFDGVAGAILYAGANQINVVVPPTVQRSPVVSLQVVRYGIPSPRAQAQVVAFEPGVFGYPAQGRTYAAALDSGGRVQGPSTPLRRGSVAVFYATGVGLAAGETFDAVAARPAEVPAPPSITIGGRRAQVLYAGVSPGLTAGLTQINVVVPADAPAGAAVEVVITAGNRSQGNVWVALQ